MSSAKDEVLTESKQIQIVKGALKLFFVQGFHPTTIREIAEECNMSMGQLYHYISSKDDVLYLVHEYFHESVFDFIKAQKIEQYATPLEKLLNFMKANMIFVSENKKIIQFISTETKYLKKDYLKDVLRMEKESTIANYYQLLVEVNKEIPINVDLEVLASILAYTVAFLPLKGWTVKDKSVNDVNRCLLNFILNGLGQSVLQEAEKLLD
jgi:AcrR family transcriptional regulator